MPKPENEQHEAWSELARQLKVSRQALLAWRRLVGAPEVAELGAWQKFVAEKSLGVAPNRVTRGRDELLRAKTEREIKLLDLKIAKEEATSMDVDEVADLLLHLSSFAKTILYQRLSRELGARCAGKTPEELTHFGNDIADEICAQLSDAITKWSDERNVLTPTGAADSPSPTAGP